MDACPDIIKADFPAPEEGRQIKEKADGLTALQGPLETMFLDIGRQLHDLSGSLRMLNEEARSLLGLLETPAFKRTLAGLDRAVEKIESNGQVRNDHGARLIDLIAKVRESGKTLDEASKILSYVRILGVNATIEVTHLGDGALNLGSFTDGILQLSHKGQNTLDRARTVLKGLAQAASRAERDWREFESAHERQVADIRRYFRTSLSVFHDRKQAIEGAMQALQTQLDEGAVLTGRIVGDLQFGDILRQRIEHVVEGLEAASTISRGEDDTDMDKDVQAAAMCDLQAAHLEDIEAHYAEKTGRSLEALEALADIVSRILEEIGMVYRHALGGGDSFLTAMAQELSAVKDVAAAYEKMTGQMQDSLRQVVDGASGVTHDMAAIREVDVDMNVLGLNAAIICGNRGWEGRTLTVLARELRLSAKNTRQLTDQAAERLDIVVAHAERLSGGHDAQGYDAQAAETDHYQGFEEDLEDWIRSLDETDRAISASLLQIERIGNDAMTGTRALVARFRDNEDMHKTLIGTARDLRYEATRLAPYLSSEDLAKLRETSLQFMQARYTMESERHIHEGQDPDNGSTDGATAEADMASIDDIFF